ncbi:hypothetical protein SAMN04489712_1448 [Thermomonospora echinospora]|uniref:BNR repeat-containing family member n=1 Tax=Thermomonospora echinospora TaxID=1992 RepID=A0A1H6E8R2_9ACTN|nr:hypothetical protein [Thermomonospora echinospora]SEG94208.1 hypothetical protein SAMN04489712_1448 [Thermomonospora echinospora]
MSTSTSDLVVGADETAALAVVGPNDLTALTGAPRTFSPHGYVRSDGRNVVVSYSASNRIRELALEGDHWASYDLTKEAGDAPRGFAPRGYVRSDGVTAVVYLGLSSDGHHMHELALIGNAWRHTDLTAKTGAIGGGTMRPYVRHDGTTVIVYRGPDGHIHELAREGNTWRHYDLTIESGAPTDPQRLPSPSDQPIGYARSDGSSAVVFRSADGEIRQLKLTNVWEHRNLTNDAGDPKATYGLAAAVRHDGVNVIFYAGQDHHLHELSLDPSGEWQHNDITALFNGPQLGDGAHIEVFPIFRSGRAMTSVVYDDADRHLNEFRLDGTWKNTDRTTQTGAPTLEPFMIAAYQRTDGVTAFLFSSHPNPDHHIFEITR